MKLILNPVAVAFAAMHWIIALFAIFGEEHTNPFHFYYEPLLTQFLFVINLPALMVGSLISLPVLYLSDAEGVTTDFLIFAICIPVVTIQWLLIGSAASLFWKPASTEKRITLID